MNSEDYILLLEDRLEEDMRSEYGKDLMMVSKEYFMLPADKLCGSLQQMNECMRARTSYHHQVKLRAAEADALLLTFDSYILRNEDFRLTPAEPYRRGVSGYRGKYHYLTFSLVKKTDDVAPKNTLEYEEIGRKV